MWFFLCVEFAMHDEKLVEAVRSSLAFGKKAQSYKDL